MKTPLYALWIKLSGEIFEALSRTIRELANELNTVVFQPHVTLLANLGGSDREIAQRSKGLAGRVAPLKIRLTEPSYQKEYFKCVFMQVEKAPPLMDANALAERIFKGPRATYEPHLSLVYGNLSEERKKLIIRDLPEDVQTDFEGRTIYVVRADSPHPKDWHEIAAFRLRG